jgi:hypothetical protein
VNNAEAFLGNIVTNNHRSLRVKRPGGEDGWAAEGLGARAVAPAAQLTRRAKNCLLQYAFLAVDVFALWECDDGESPFVRANTIPLRRAFQRERFIGTTEHQVVCLFN